MPKRPSPAGYSGTPLPKKLGIRAHSSVALIEGPLRHAFDPRPVDALAPWFTAAALPDGVRIRHDLRGRATFDVVLWFVDRASTLERRFDTLARRTTEAGGLWIAWPKRASKIPTDVTEAQVRATGLASGLVDNKICAIDETWSGLRFVVRLENRGP